MAEDKKKDGNAQAKTGGKSKEDKVIHKSVKIELGESRSQQSKFRKAMELNPKPKPKKDK